MTLHEALRILPPETMMKDVYRLFGGDKTIAELLQTARDEPSYEVQVDERTGKRAIAPVGQIAVLREQ